MKLGTCKLEEIARVGLGFKSLQNQFFYVSKEKYAILRSRSVTSGPFISLPIWNQASIGKRRSRFNGSFIAETESRIYAELAHYATFGP